MPLLGCCVSVTNKDHTWYRGGSHPCLNYIHLLKNACKNKGQEHQLKFIQTDMSSYTAQLSPSKIIAVADFKSNGHLLATNASVVV